MSNNKEPTITIQRQTCIKTQLDKCVIEDSSYRPGIVVIMFSDRDANSMFDYMLSLKQENVEILKKCIDSYLETKGKLQ